VWITIGPASIATNIVPTSYVSQAYSSDLWATMFIARKPCQRCTASCTVFEFTTRIPRRFSIGRSTRMFDCVGGYHTEKVVYTQPTSLTQIVLVVISSLPRILLPPCGKPILASISSPPLLDSSQSCVYERIARATVGAAEVSISVSL
jgi:hypothetical protein